MKKQSTTGVTPARKAQGEIQDYISKDTDFYYKPYQLVDYDIQNITLKSTFDEILLLSKEQCMYRPFWNVEENNVYIPNFFTKIEGVFKEDKKYLNLLNELLEGDNSLFITAQKLVSFEVENILSNSTTLAYQIQRVEYLDNQETIYESELFSVGNLLKLRECLTESIDYSTFNFKESELWPYSHLPNHVENMLYKQIFNFVNHKNKVFSKPILNSHIYFVLSLIPVEILELLVKFDYPKLAPRIVIYTDPYRNQLSLYRTILLQFLHSIGFDIIILSPNGHEDIEELILESRYDKQLLDTFQSSFSVRNLKKQKKNFLSVFRK